MADLLDGFRTSSIGEASYIPATHSQDENSFGHSAVTMVGEGRGGGTFAGTVKAKTQFPVPRCNEAQAEIAPLRPFSSADSTRLSGHDIALETTRAASIARCAIPLRRGHNLLLVDRQLSGSRPQHFCPNGTGRVCISCVLLIAARSS